MIIVGRFGAPYGVKGWIKVHSFTVPISNLIDYQPWHIADQKGAWQSLSLTNVRTYNKGIVAKIEQCDDRDAAIIYRNCDIAIPRDQLPAADENEFYWTDLEGLTVKTLDGTTLGSIKQLFATGANDVMVVKGEKEHLIPFVLERFVIAVDQENNVITVDWDPEF